MEFNAYFLILKVFFNIRILKVFLILEIHFLILKNHFLILAIEFLISENEFLILEKIVFIDIRN